MSNTSAQYRHPPIVEAIIDIECDFAEQPNLADWEKIGTELFYPGYPKHRTQFVHEISFKVEAEEASMTSGAHLIQAHQFLSADERQLVQARRSGFSFNRLAPYTSLDEYVPEVRDGWEKYRNAANPLRVRALRIRYINRIHLPMESGGVELDDYFTNGPRLPDESGLVFTGFLIQNMAREQETGFQVHTILTAEPPSIEGLTVIFDNAASADELDIAPDDWSAIEAKLMDLRRLKNLVFQRTMSGKCLSLFS